MSVTEKSKGKEKAIEEVDEAESTDSSVSSASEDDSESESEDEEITQDYLNSLLDKARKNYVYAEGSSRQNEGHEDMIALDTDYTEKPLPALQIEKILSPYLTLNDAAAGGRPSLRDPEVEAARAALSVSSGPAPPLPPLELSQSGKPLTKREKKELKKKTAGPEWYDLPAPSESDLPKLHREVEALRLRNQLDPKRFYRKDEGDGKGIKGLPKYFAIGTILPSNTPFGTASSENLTRANRKRTLVDELVGDAEARHYAKKKFIELQGDRGARGRRTLQAKKAMRKPKW